MKLKQIRTFYFNKIPVLLISLGVLCLLLAYGPLIKDELWYKLKELKNQQYLLGGNGQKESVFAKFLSSAPVSIEPVNRDFSLVIEKIDVNAPIVADVNVADESAYMIALQNGIAHASRSPYPSKLAGNTYLFAHASINFWQAGRYATVFNLLRKIELGDKIHVFYKNYDYVYKTVNKEYLKGWNTYSLLRPVIEPTLTIQTCDPPGTTINRLVLTANLVDVLPHEENL